MAKVILNPLIKQMYGRSGDVIYRRTPKGETIVYQAPAPVQPLQGSVHQIFAHP